MKFTASHKCPEAYESPATYSGVFHRRIVGAFTRMELAAVIAAVGLLMLAIAPAIGHSRGSSDRAVCANNLRNLGNAVQQWTIENPRHQTPWWTPSAQGGAQGNPFQAETWYQLTFFTNELASPSITACPADRGVEVARDWPRFRQPEIRAKAVSYALGVEASGMPGRAFLMSDLNLRFDFFSGFSCATGMGDIPGVIFRTRSGLTWTNAVHGELGNVLLFDGAVEFASKAQLTNLVLNYLNDDGGVIHALKAR